MLRHARLSPSGREASCRRVCPSSYNFSSIHSLAADIKRNPRAGADLPGVPTLQLCLVFPLNCRPECVLRSFAVWQPCWVWFTACKNQPFIGFEWQLIWRICDQPPGCHEMTVVAHGCTVDVRLQWSKRCPSCCLNPEVLVLLQPGRPLHFLHCQSMLQRCPTTFKCKPPFNSIVLLDNQTEGVLGENSTAIRILNNFRVVLNAFISTMIVQSPAG